ncbi:MAG: PilN domain-containing protein [Gemmatimonadota bacterium]|jgi:Tfp pilus assembly protein PilN|nr:PilN domain-containing protein [Gemmatimonadota bacterium]
MGDLMIRINLLDAGSEEVAASPRVFGVPRNLQAAQAGVAGLAFFWMALIAGWGWVIRGLYANTGDTADLIAVVAADSLLLVEEFDLLKRVEAETDIVAERVALVQQLDGRRHIWPLLLDEVSAALPRGVWLREIISALPVETPESPVFVIHGFTQSAALVSKYLHELEISPHVRDVTLGNMNLVKRGVEGAIHQFAMQARFEVGELPLSSPPSAPGE